MSRISTSTSIEAKFISISRELNSPFISIETLEPLFNNLKPSLPNLYQYLIEKTHSDLLLRTIKNCNELLLPGDLNHIWHRKLFMLEKVNLAIQNGYKTIVILGVGFDLLPLMINNNKVRIILIDNNVLSEAYWENIENVTYLNLNLNNYKHCLSTLESLQLSDSTVWLTEGIFDYLIPENAKLWINILKEQCLKKSHKWLSTWFCIKDMTKVQRVVFQLAIRAVNEKIKFTYSYSDLRKWLTDTNLEMNLYSSPLLYKKYSGVNSNIMNGFYMMDCYRSNER